MSIRRTVWDRFIDREAEADGSPYESYSGWERWMAEMDKRQADRLDDLNAPCILEAVDDILAKTELYSRFVDAATGAGIPWHVRLWDVLTEPVVVGWWRLYFFRHELRRDYREVVRSINAGRWPERSEDGLTWTLYRRDPATGRPVLSCYRGMFAWERAIPWSWANRRRRAAIRAMEKGA